MEGQHSSPRWRSPPLRPGSTHHVCCCCFCWAKHLDKRDRKGFINWEGSIFYGKRKKKKKKKDDVRSGGEVKRCKGQQPCLSWRLRMRREPTYMSLCLLSVSLPHLRLYLLSYILVNSGRKLKLKLYDIKNPFTSSISFEQKRP